MEDDVFVKRPATPLGVAQRPLPSLEWREATPSHLWRWLAGHPLSPIIILFVFLLLLFFLRKKKIKIIFLSF